MAFENYQEIPTKEEIASLPRWARVAFAARCARRVQPLFVHEWSNALQKEIDNVDRVITLAESSAASHNIASEFSSGTSGYSASTEYSTYSAYSADSAAESAYSAYSVDSADSAIASAFSAARDAYSAFFSFTSTTNAGIRADFELLKELVRGEPNKRVTASGESRATDQGDTRVVGYSNSWTDDTPVPPEIFGPMWPDGVPEGWPKLSDDEEQLYLKIELAVPQGMSEEESDDFNERTARFFAKLSAAHVAMGGTGLRIVEDASCAVEPILIEDNEPVGAGSSSDKEGWGQ